MVLDYKLGNLLLLKSFGRAANAIAKQSEEIRESAAFSALAAHLSILEYEHIHLPDDKEHLRQLFMREVEFRAEFEEALLDRVAALPDTDMAGWCEALINEDPYSTAAGRAANLLGRFGGGEAVRILVYSLALDGSDYLYDTAIDALKHLQDPQVITRLAPVFESGNRSSIIAALGVLRNYPVQETVDLVSKHFHKLWIDYCEPLLRLIESIASADFIPQLKKEVKSGETYVEEVYVLLCDLHNFHDPELPEIRREVEGQEAVRKRKSEAFSGLFTKKSLKDLMDKTIRVELRCKRCQHTYHYDADTVYVDPEVDPPEGIFIDQHIECKNCGAVNEYEFTGMTRMAILAEMFKADMVSKQLGKKAYAGPLKFMGLAMADGTRANPFKAMEIYRQRIQDDPQNSENYLRLGNILGHLDRFPEAIEQYQKAIQINPLECEAYTNLVEIYWEQGEWIKAEGLRRKVCIGNDCPA